MKWNNFIFATTLLAASCGKQESKSEVQLINMEYNQGNSYFIGKSGLDYSMFWCKPNVPRSMVSCQKIGRSYPIKFAPDLAEDFEKLAEGFSKEIKETEKQIVETHPQLIEMKKLIILLHDSVSKLSSETNKIKTEIKELSSLIEQYQKHAEIFDLQLVQINQALIKNPQDESFIAMRINIANEKRIAFTEFNENREKLEKLEIKLAESVNVYNLFEYRIKSEEEIYEQEKNFILSNFDGLGLQDLKKHEKTFKNRAKEVSNVLKLINEDFLPYDLNAMSADRVAVVMKLFDKFSSDFFSSTLMAKKYVELNRDKLLINEPKLRNINGKIEKFGTLRYETGFPEWYTIDGEYSEELCASIGKSFLYKETLDEVAHFTTRYRDNIILIEKEFSGKAANLFCI